MFNRNWCKRGTTNCGTCGSWTGQNTDHTRKHSEASVPFVLRRDGRIEKGQYCIAFLGFLEINQRLP